MEGTRLRILQHLQQSGQDTVDGLARFMELAPATIRRHLDILQRDRYVTFDEVRKKTGRPEYSFYLTENGQEAMPKAYDKLLGMVIGEVASLKSDETSGKTGEQVLRLVFRRLSDRASGQYESQVRGQGLEQKLEILVSHLRESDFSPDVEVRDGTLRIKLMNCPFRSVALEHESVCTYDSNLIAKILDVDLQRQGCIHDGEAHCVYTAEVPADAVP